MLIYSTTFSNCALEIDYYFLLAFSSFFTTQVTTGESFTNINSCIFRDTRIMAEMMV